MPDAADIEIWTRSRVTFELKHLLCCDPASGSCNLRVVEVERRRSGTPEWASFQLAAHARADIVGTMARLWPVTRSLDWEFADDETVRALPALPQALWVLVIRGPGGQTDRTPLPKNQAPKSRFGFVSEHEAERILRRRRERIYADLADAIGQMLQVLNGPTTAKVTHRYAPGIQCAPGRHEFSIDGTPPGWMESRCFCGRVTWMEHIIERARSQTPCSKLETT